MRLIGGGIVLWGLLSLIGVLVTHVMASERWQSWDRRVDVWLAAHRTGSWNTITAFGSGMANTRTVVIVTVVAVVFMRWRLGRWYESGIVVAAAVGELLVFLAVTATVHRHRPTVTRLDESPPTSSYPSGHTAAAIAVYGCLAVLLLWIYGRRRSTRIVAVVLFCAPVVVGLSRLYRGMHYPTDILAGALGGGLWLLLVITTFLPRDRPSAFRRDDPHPGCR